MTTKTKDTRPATEFGFLIRWYRESWFTPDEPAALRIEIIERTPDGKLKGHSGPVRQSYEFESYRVERQHLGRYYDGLGLRAHWFGHDDATRPIEQVRLLGLQWDYNGGYGSSDCIPSLKAKLALLQRLERGYEERSYVVAKEAVAAEFAEFVFKGALTLGLTFVAFEVPGVPYSKWADGEFEFDSIHNFDGSGTLKRRLEREFEAHRQAAFDARKVPA